MVKREDYTKEVVSEANRIFTQLCEGDRNFQFMRDVLKTVETYINDLNGECK